VLKKDNSSLSRKLKINQSLYRDKTAFENTDYPTTENAKTLDDIDWSKFTTDAVIESHGCKTAAAKDFGGSNKDGNIMMIMSKKLYAAGKTRAVTIGHTQNANPNINGDGKTKDEEQDYRQGERVIYWNGNEILKISEKGAITHETIDKAINDYNEKQKNEKK